MRQRCIVDFEFTGLDNTFTKDNQIIQAKALNVKTGERISKNYSSMKRIGAHAYLAHEVERYEGESFTREAFRRLLTDVGVNPDRKTEYFGFGTDQDKKMLGKYGVRIDPIDIRELLQRSRFEERLATEGSGLECAYYIVTGKHPRLRSHDGPDELRVIFELYKKAMRLRKKERLTVMPFGHCAGMPIREYVRKYRRAANGHRFHNSDLLGRSMDAAIAEHARESDYAWDDSDGELV